MPQILLRGELRAAEFPLLSGQFGRSIIIAQNDEQSTGRADFSGSEAYKDIGVPQVFFAQNVMPTKHGIASVGFYSDTAAMFPATNDFDTGFTLRDPSDGRSLFSPALGRNYIYSKNAINNNWKAYQFAGIGGFPNYPCVVKVTIANVKFNTYICYSGTVVFKYDPVADALVLVTLTALTLANILGICGSANYMIAWTNTTVFWSSTLTETDFTPSLTTGAGSIIPNQLRGTIVSCTPLDDGFLIWTTANIVSAVYTGNVQSPWIFHEVDSGAGITDYEKVGFEADTQTQFAWTVNGLMQVNKKTAIQFAPDVSDFIASKTIESWVNFVLTSTVSPTALVIKVNYIGQRYLVISYGAAQLTHALIYDTVLQRWGKVMITHVRVFEYAAPLQYINSGKFSDYPATSFNGLPGAKFSDFRTLTASVLQHGSNIGFLLNTGEVRVMNWFGIGLVQNSVAILGKYQVVRARFVDTQELELETIKTIQPPTVRIGYSTDGKNFNYSGIIVPSANSGGDYWKYQQMVSGKNIAYEISGSITELVTMIGTLTVGGLM